MPDIKTRRPAAPARTLPPTERLHRSDIHIPPPTPLAAPCPMPLPAHHSGREKSESHTAPCYSTGHPQARKTCTAAHHFSDLLRDVNTIFDFFA